MRRQACLIVAAACAIFALPRSVAATPPIPPLQRGGEGGVGGDDDAEVVAIDREIAALARPAASSAADADLLRHEAERRLRLVNRMDRWLSAHPRHAAGGRMTISKLEQRFLAETSADRPLDALKRDLDALAPATLPPALAAEAAYWRLKLDLAQLDRAALGSRPSQDVRAGRIRGFLADHPDALHAPELFDEWIESCCAAGDFAAAARALGQLKERFPDHVITQARLARDRLLRARGETWRPSIMLTDARPFDWAAVAGRPVIVAFWATWDSRSLSELAALKRAGRVHPAVVAVSLDASIEDARRALRGIEADWPLACDGLGWSGPLARNWGVRRLPAFLVVDARGLLIDVAPDAQTVQQLLGRKPAPP